MRMFEKNGTRRKEMFHKKERPWVVLKNTKSGWSKRRQKRHKRMHRFHKNEDLLMKKEYFHPNTII